MHRMLSTSRLFAVFDRAQEVKNRFQYHEFYTKCSRRKVNTIRSDTSVTFAKWFTGWFLFVHVYLLLPQNILPAASLNLKTCRLILYGFMYVRVILRMCIFRISNRTQNCSLKNDWFGIIRYVCGLLCEQQSKLFWMQIKRQDCVFIFQVVVFSLCISLHSCLSVCMVCQSRIRLNLHLNTFWPVV